MVDKPPPSITFFSNTPGHRKGVTLGNGQFAINQADGVLETQTPAGVPRQTPLDLSSTVIPVVPEGGIPPGSVQDALRYLNGKTTTGSGGGPANTDALPEGSTNRYFTNVRARAAISATGSIAFDATTGVISSTAPAAYTLPIATASTLGGVKANAGSAGQFVNGVAGDGSLTYGTPAGGATALAGLADVTTTGAIAGSVLKYDGTSKWIVGTDNAGSGGGVSLGSATPLANAGTAAVGISGAAAHEDHVHPTDTSRQASSTTLTNIAALTGAASKLVAFTGTNTVTTLTYGTSGANAILQLDGTGKLPALDGSALTSLPSQITGNLSALQGLTGAANRLPAFTGAGAMTVLTYGTTGTANSLLQLDATGKIPAVDGSQITNLPAGLALGSTTPLGNGAAAVGVATTAARSDHVHPTDTGRQALNANLTALSGLTGAANRLAAFTGAGAMTLLPYGTSGVSTLVQTDGTGKLPALDGSQLTGVVPVLTMAAASDVWAGTDNTKPLTAKAIADANALQSSTGSGTYAPNLSAGFYFERIANGASTVAPTGGVPGYVYQIRLTQDATGSRTWAFNASIDFGSAGTPTPSTGAGKMDILFLDCLASGSYRGTFNKAA